MKAQVKNTSITKMKAVDYGQVKWIEDKVSRIWISIKVVYDRHAYWGTYHWSLKRHKFYGYASNMETSKDVYSRHMIITVTSLKIIKWFGYSHLEAIEDMLPLLVQDKKNGVKSYQKKINLKKTDTCRLDLKRITAYTVHPDIQGIIYEDEMNKKYLMRTDELHKFSDGTLNHVRTALNDIKLGIEMDYLPKRKYIKQDKQRARVMINAIDKKLKDRRLMRS
nr:hypothetical protein [Tanacetum cinerariifolium]